MHYLADQIALLFFRSLAVFGFMLGAVGLAMLAHVLLTRLFEFLAARSLSRRAVRGSAAFSGTKCRRIPPPPSAGIH